MELECVGKPSHLCHSTFSVSDSFRTPLLSFYSVRLRAQASTAHSFGVFSQLSTSPSHQLTLHRQALCDPVLFDLVTVAILETTSTPLPRP